MVAIKDETKDGILRWLNYCDKRHTYGDEDSEQLRGLIAELENAPAVPDREILVAVWKRDGAEYRMRVDATIGASEDGTGPVLNIPNDYLDVCNKHGFPNRFEMIRESEYAKRFTSGDACEFFATEVKA